MKPGRFFNWEGRLARGAFWLQALAVWIAFYAASSLLGPEPNGIAVWLVNFPALVVLVLMCVRRLHDRNLSGWWLSVALVPVAGAAWLLWQLACRRGVAEDNRWGPDPLRASGDYLVVR